MTAAAPPVSPHTAPTATAAVPMPVPSVARRVVFPAIRRAEWEAVPLPTPDRLGPTEVLVQTVCTLVSAGTEIAVYSGTHIGYAYAEPTGMTRLPHRPGYAAAGIVSAVGGAVADLHPGDRVAGALKHTDWSVVDTARARLVRLPDGVSFEQACLARLSTIAVQGVRLARVQFGVFDALTDRPQDHLGVVLQWRLA